MLKSLRIKNFKAWKDTGEIRLAPLTVIFGANSAGKSSIGHLIQALKQTAVSTDRFRALHTGDQNSPVDLGTFEDCLHNHDLKNPLEFALKWDLPENIEVSDKLQKFKFQGNTLLLNSSIEADSKRQPQTKSVRYFLTNDKNEKLEAKFYKEAKQFQLELSDNYELAKEPGRPWPLEVPEKFYRISEKSLARYKNASFLTDFALATESFLSGIFFLGPLRESPKRVYGWAGDTPPDVGPNGARSIQAILAADMTNRKLQRPKKRGYDLFQTFIANWLKDLKIIDSFTVAPVAEGRKEYEVLLRVTENSPEVKLTDVGFGVSQVLPALVEAFYAPPGSTVWMEQPEIHLHPQVQAELANAFACAIKASENGKPRNTQLIIESHSEHLLNRLQLLLAQNVLKPEDVAIYFCTTGSDGAKLEYLEIDAFGEISNWPQNFFGDQMADIAGRTLAAIKRNGGK